MNDNDIITDDLIIEINNLIKETGLSEFEELKESIDDINFEVNRIILKNAEIKQKNDC